MKQKLFYALLLSVMVTFGSFGLANAGLISGAIWAPANASAEDPEIVPTFGSIATFTIDAINFDSTRGTLTYKTFLWGDLNSNINGLDNLVFSTTVYDEDDFYTTNTPQYGGSFFQFKGTAYFEANTVIRHDDGFFLTLGANTYDRSLPTSAVDYDLANAAGTYDFTLNYGANNDFPEVLIAPMQPVPEPATMLLFGAGLMGLAGLRSRRKK